MPAFTTLPLPLTGEARKATPRSAQAARIASEADWSTVEQSTTIRGTSAGSASRPPSPSSTCSRSLLVDTIVKTTSMPRSSAMLSAIEQPNSASGSALARVRFQTVTLVPALARRVAMAAPMRPAPIQPTDPIGVETGLSLMCAPRWCAARFGGRTIRGRSGQARGEPVGGVGAVPRRDVRAAVVAVLEHQQFDLAAGRLAQPLGVPPRDQPVLAAEDDQQRGGDRRADPLERQRAGDLARLVVVGRAGADLERLPGELRELVPAVAEVERARERHAGADAVAQSGGDPRRVVATEADAPDADAGGVDPGEGLQRRHDHLGDGRPVPADRQGGLPPPPARAAGGGGGPPPV